MDMTVEPGQVAVLLARLPEVLTALVGDLDDGLLCWRPEPEAWCIKEVIGHLIATDTAAFADRIAYIMAHDGEPFPAVSAGEMAAARQDVAQPIGALLAELTAVRSHNAAWIRQLSLDQLQSRGVYPKYGTFHAYDFLYEWPYHDQSHLQQIGDILKAYFFPHMSQTMQQALS